MGKRVRMWLVVCLTIVCCMCGKQKVMAETSGDFVYEVSQDGNSVTITGYGGSGGEVTVPGEIDGKKVTGIGGRAFHDCSSLTKIKLPEGLETIGSQVFYYCSSLTEVTLPEGLETIGYGAFEFCSSLTEVTLPEGLEKIENYAFSGCSSLTEIALPESLKSIYSSAFGNCTNLTALQVGTWLGKIHTGQISLSNIQTLTLTDQAGQVSDSVWKSFSGLSEIKVSEDNAYYSAVNGVLFNKDQTTLIYYPPCREMEEYAIPDTVTTVAGTAFYGCTGVKSVVVPDQVATVESGAFVNAQITEFTLGKAASLLSRDWYQIRNDYYDTYYSDTISYVRSIHYTSTAESVDTSTLALFPSLEQIVAAEDAEEYSSVDGVLFNKEQTRLVFYPAKKAAEEYVVPDGVTRIEKNAFQNSTAVQAVRLPENLTYIGNSAFSGSTALKQITIPDKVSAVGASAFAGCTALEEIHLGTSLANIGNFAFSGCTALKQIAIPDKVSTVGQSAFAGCTALEEVALGTGVKAVMASAFSNCSSLTGIVLPEGLTTIGESAFQGCTGLKQITVPEKVTTLGTSVWGNCSGLETVELLAGITQLPECSFWNCAALKSVALPDTLTGIGNYAFDGCSSLERMELKEGVQTISYRAFENCEQLQELILPDTLQSVDRNSFSGCTALSSLKLGNGWDMVQYGYSYFDDCPLEQICLREGNTRYMVEDGVLFSKDQTRLILYPRADERTSYTVPEGVKFISPYAFSKALKLKEIVLPDTVEQIGKSGFSGCKALWEVTLPQQTWYLGEGVFSGCTGLTEVTFLRPNLSCSDLPDTVMIRCYDDSAAYTYAVNNNREFELMGAYTCTAHEAPYTYYSSDGQSYKNYSYTQSVAASCENAGMHRYTCVFCGEEVEEEIPALGHNWELWYTNQSPTCTAEGQGRYVCQNCRNWKEDSIPMTAHTWSEDYRELEAPTETTLGREAHYCTVCGAFDEEHARDINPAVTLTDEDVELEQTGYQYDGTAKEPSVTVTFNGTALVKDTDYLVKYENQINAGSADGENAPAVTVYGIGIYRGTVVKHYSIAPKDGLPEGAPEAELNVGKQTDTVGKIVLNARWRWQNGDLEIPEGRTVEAAAEYSGTDSANYTQTSLTVRIHRSAVCIHPLENQEIRNAKSATCTQDGYTGDAYCTLCNDTEPVTTGTVIPAVGHTWDEGVVIKEPTVETEGIRLLTCTVCGQNRQEAIEKLPVDPVEQGTVRITFVDETGAEIADSREEQGAVGEAYGTDAQQTIVKEGIVYLLKTRPDNASGIYTQDVISVVYVYEKTQTEEDQLVELLDENVQLAKDSFAFDGTPIRPEVSVIVGEKKLTEATDYVVSYENNIHAAGSDAENAPQVRVFGIGAYKGTVRKTFTIAPSETLLPEGAPSMEMHVGSNMQKVGDIVLNARWRWKAEDREKVLADTVQAVAEYTGSDSTDYSTVSVTVTITRSDTCEHPLEYREIRGAKSASCQQDGYTGDEYCTKCNAEEPIVKGSVIPALEHKWGEGIVIKEATKEEEGSMLYVCKECGYSRVETIAKLQEETEPESDTGLVTVRYVDGDGTDVMASQKLTGKIGESYHTDTYRTIISDSGDTYVLVEKPDHMEGVYTESPIGLIFVYEKKVESQEDDKPGNTGEGTEDDKPGETGEGTEDDKPGNTGEGTENDKPGETGEAQKPESEKDASDIANADIVLEEVAQIYDGTEKKPAVTIKANGNALAEKKDYLLYYANNIEACSKDAEDAPVVIVYGIGAYHGDTSRCFTIEQTVELPDGAPASVMEVGDPARVVGDITLGSGWTWKEEDAAKPLEGASVSATAVYKGADASNYRIVNVTVRIKRTAGGQSAQTTEDPAGGTTENLQDGSTEESGQNGTTEAQQSGSTEASEDVGTTEDRTAGTTETPGQTGTTGEQTAGTTETSGQSGTTEEQTAETTEAPGQTGTTETQQSGSTEISAGTTEGQTAETTEAGATEEPSTSAGTEPEEEEQEIPEGYAPIYTVADLNAVRNQPDGKFILMRDIDLSKATAEGGDYNTSGTGWVPIEEFNGVFDGNGHRIIGMHIYGTPKDRHIGLFGGLYGEVTRLGLVDVDINISDGSYDIGGIAGHGYGTLTKLSESYCKGTIRHNGTGAVGGLIGDTQSDSGIIINCVNMTDIVADKAASTGGVTAYAETIETCYNIGKIEGEKAYSISYERYGYYPLFQNTYYLKDSATNGGRDRGDSAGECTVLTETMMKEAGSFGGFDFDEVWEIDPYCEAYPYPQLKKNRVVRIKSLGLTNPTKLEYLQGETLNLAGSALEIRYENGVNTTVPVKEKMLGEYDMTEIGKQTISVCYGGKEQSFEIEVKEIPVESITVDPKEISIYRTKTTQLTCVLSPQNPSDPTVTWSSTDSSVATVDETGLVTAKAKGTAVISAVSSNGIKAECTVTVLVPSREITLNQTSLSMKRGQSITLQTSLNPMESTDAVTWVSSDPAVADVMEGTVIAKGEGTAVITAHAESGVEASCSVTVQSEAEPAHRDTQATPVPTTQAPTTQAQVNPSQTRPAGTQPEVTASIGSTEEQLVEKVQSAKAKIKSAKNVKTRSIRLNLNGGSGYDGYQIQYGLKANFSSARKFSKKSGTVTIKKLKKGKAYYVRARVYKVINGTTYYGKWSAKKKVKIKK